MKKVLHVSIRAYFITLLLLTFVAFGLLGTTKAKAQGANIPKSFFLEHPYVETSVSARGEWINLDEDGSLWMNEFRFDLNLYQNLFGLYARLPFAGVTDFGPTDEDEYNIGNLAIGGKFALVNLPSSVVTVGLETIVPTVDDDIGALGALGYFRDFSYFLDDTVTLKPYAIFGASRGIFAIQGNVDFDIILDAEEIEGDDSELIIKYGGTASMTPELNLPFSTSFLLEVLAASSTTFDDNITGVYITPGVRLEGQVLSIGAGVEIPLGSDEIQDFADVGVVLDLIFRFGS